MYDNKKFNVLTRGKHTLFVIAQMDGKRKRDPEKLRLQIANMLGVEPKAVIPNHDYDSLPEGKWFCYRWKQNALPARIRRPSIEEDRHLFCAKEMVLNIVEDKPAPKKVAKGMQDIPGLPDAEEAQSEGDAPVVAPMSSNDKALLQVLKMLEDVMRNQQYIVEQLGLEVAKRR